MTISIPSNRIDSRNGRHYLRLLERARCAEFDQPTQAVHHRLARALSYNGCTHTHRVFLSICRRIMLMLPIQLWVSSNACRLSCLAAEYSKSPSIRM